MTCPPPPSPPELSKPALDYSARIVRDVLQGWPPQHVDDAIGDVRLYLVLHFRRYPAPPGDWRPAVARATRQALSKLWRKSRCRPLDHAAYLEPGVLDRRVVSLPGQEDWVIGRQQAERARADRVAELLQRVHDEQPEQVEAVMEALKRVQHERPAWTGIVVLLLEGLSAAQVAEELGQSTKTVKRVRAWMVRGEASSQAPLFCMGASTAMVPARAAPRPYRKREAETPEPGPALFPDLDPSSSSTAAARRTPRTSNQAGSTHDRVRPLQAAALYGDEAMTGDGDAV